MYGRYEKDVSKNFKGSSQNTYPAKHALVRHDTHGEEVDRCSVVLATHDLRRHVAWGPRSILGVILAPDTRNAEVSDPEVAYTNSKTELIFRSCLKLG